MGFRKISGRTVSSFLPKFSLFQGFSLIFPASLYFYFIGFLLIAIYEYPKYLLAFGEAQERLLCPLPNRNASPKALSVLCGWIIPNSECSHATHLTCYWCGWIIPNLECSHATHSTHQHALTGVAWTIMWLCKVENFDTSCLFFLFVFSSICWWMKLIFDVLLSAATICQVFASPLVLSAAAMVCSHCCQQTVPFLTFPFFFGFVCVIFRRAYLAVHVCGAGFRCHTCNPIYLGYGGGPIWLYAFVVPDFGANHVAPSIVGCRGGLFGHVCLWCQILVPRVRPPSVVDCGGLPGHVCLVPDFGAMHARWVF